MLDIYYCYSAYYNKAGNTLEIFLLNILLVQKIRLIFAFIKRTFIGHFYGLISSLIAYYHCKSVQYGLGGKMSRSNREAHPELS